jgi:hypothetical protein
MSKTPKSMSPRQRLRSLSPKGKALLKKLLRRKFDRLSNVSPAKTTSHDATQLRQLKHDRAALLKKAFPGLKTT